MNSDVIVPANDRDRDHGGGGDILAAMREKALKRRERYETFFVDEMPTKQEIGGLHISGSLSIVDLKKRRRFLLRPALVNLGEGVRESPTAAARDYLLTQGFKASRLRGSTRDRVLARIDVSPALPFYVAPFRGDDGIYLDIRKAFFALMAIGGWSVGYDPGKYLVKGRAPLDFPLASNSLARNSLVSCSSGRQMYALTPPDWHSICLSHFNPILNSSLNAWIRDVLQSIASRAVEAGAVYVQTDGFVAPNPKTARVIGGIIEDYGLAFSVKGRGETDVQNVGTYRVGRHKTLTYDTRPRLTDPIKTGIRDIPERRWLEYKMQSIAAMDGALHLVSDKL